MKKVITIVLSTIAILVLFCACSSEARPENISDKHYQYGCKALDIVDQYLDNIIDAETAVTRLDNLQRLDGSTLPETESVDPAHFNNTRIEMDTTQISHELLMIKIGTGLQSKLLEDRNRLAEDLGMKKK